MTLKSNLNIGVILYDKDFYALVGVEVAAMAKTTNKQSYYGENNNC